MSRDHNVAMHTVCSQIDTSVLIRHFLRIVLNGEVIHSLQYCRNLKRNSYVVQLADGAFFEIDIFVVHNNDNAECCYAIGRFFRVNPSFFGNSSDVQTHLGHIVAVDKHLGRLVAIKAERIRRKCIFISLINRKNSYICRQLNNVEYCS